MLHCIYPDDLPPDCIADCSASGDVDAEVDYWVCKLDFQVPPERARDCLKRYGAWDAEELADDEQNRRRILWLACCDFKDGSDIFCVEG